MAARLRMLAALVAILFAVHGPAWGHDVPDDVTVQAFLRPSGQRLVLLVRVPLTAMRDVDVPTRDRYIDLTRVEATLRNAATLWLTQAIELDADGRSLGGGQLTGVRLSLPSDSAFEGYETALAQLEGPALPPSTQLLWEQGALDARIEFPLERADARLAIRTDFRRLGQRVTVVLRLITPAGSVRAFEWRGDPGVVEIDPRWHQAALSFLRAGMGHVLSGPDHLLFLLCIAIPLVRLRTLALIVTSFTVAHAATVIAAAYGVAPDGLWFPPLVETLIAVSIVWMALENIVESARGSDRAAAGAIGRRWAIMTLFGLVHGFAFSFALREQLQFAGAHLLTSLVSFNVGVEIAQLAVIAAAAVALRLTVRRMADPRLGTIIASALAVHTGWHWMIERGAVLQAFPWPAIAAAQVATVAVWLAIAMVAGAVAWVVRILVDRRTPRRTPAPSPYSHHEATESLR